MFNGSGILGHCFWKFSHRFVGPLGQFKGSAVIGGMMIALCSFRYFVMDQKPQYAGFWWRGKDEVRIRVEERLKTANLPEQLTESGFDCFSHYFERTYFDAVKQGYSEVMRIAATRIKHRPKLDFEKARMPMVEVRW